MNDELRPHDLQIRISLEPFRISQLFHTVNHIIPDDQELSIVRPNTLVRDALRLMKDRGYSQLPVIEGEVVLGVFSFGSFATRLSELRNAQVAPEELPVDEFLDHVGFAEVTDDALSIVAQLEEVGVVLVGSLEHLQALVTPSDLIRYLDRVSRPFLLLGEIELSIRELISMCIDDQGLAECLANSHGHLMDERADIPRKLDEMSFNDYAQIVGNGRNWPRFVPVFGGARGRTRTRLEEIRDLRNDVFHFRGERHDDEVRTLYDHRNWFLTKVRTVEARGT